MGKKQAERKWGRNGIKNKMGQPMQLHANIADATSVIRPRTLYFGTMQHLHFIYIPGLACIYKLLQTRTAITMELLTFQVHAENRNSIVS